MLGVCLLVLRLASAHPEPKVDFMKKFTLALVLLLALVAGARAQVTAEIVLEQEHFLLGEEINAAVKITNRSGQTLHLGDDAKWLTFTIETRSGQIVAKQGEVPVDGAFELESGKVATRRVNLQPYFSWSDYGGYRARANVQIKNWDAVVVATPKSFDLIKGAKLWAQDFGMLLPEGVTNRAPEVRRYSLEKASYLRSQLRLYLRILDADSSQVRKVLPIGPMVSLSNPEQQIDRLNQLHVLYQTGPRTYLYTVVTPDGEMVLRQTHEITAGRPRLLSDDKGNWGVVGGARRYSPDDLPAVKEAETDVTPK